MGIKRGYIRMMESWFRIGMGGHQQLGDEKAIQFVEQQCEALLKRYRVQANMDGKELIACAALALGADRLFMKKALDL